MALQIGLLALFLLCGLVYGRANRDLMRLEQIRIEKEPVVQPKDMFGTAADLSRRLGMRLVAGSEELKAFCARNGMSQAYDRATRRIYGSLLLALASIYGIIKTLPQTTIVP